MGLYRDLSTCEKHHKVGCFFVIIMCRASGNPVKLVMTGVYEILAWF
jgi:hypothetical protein